ncbi:MAG: alpha amylase C-terminal domain-containing protein [Chitinophagaceae bacterium]|nr:alpha amylase C-terminal domain-containing protein [Chitinophagaceae bacterium]
MNNNLSHPDWSYNSNIYEVNVRQYTPEGTFEAFEKHLPRLKDMGVEILWFMPITPISLKDRKGTLGSYYAVQNYTEVNPEFGSLKDFKNLVYNAHSFGFKVIIDWVANHTGNDNVWIDLHPDFFAYNEETKEILHPNGWEDVTKLNYDNEDMQDAMIDAMKFWITTVDIDGFRCDMAHLVTLDFWKKTKAELDKVKPQLFWLAECEEPNYHEVFDATYTWNWMHKTEDYLKQNENVVPGFFDVLSHYNNSFAQDAFRVYFTSNHDENSWNGTEYEKYGNAARLLSVFSCTWNGIPMIYSGQELPNYKRLKFFDKDEIEWTEQNELHEFYKRLLMLRKTNNALRAGDPGVITNKISTNYDEKVFAFIRSIDEHAVLVILNFSSEAYDVDMKNITGKFKNIYNSQYYDAHVNSILSIEPWGYFLFEKTG